MPVTHYSVWKIVLLVTVFLLPVLTCAQQEDTVKLLSEDMDRVVADTAIIEAPAEVTDEEEYQDEPVITTSIYFLKKEEQANGGGPDSVQRRKIPDSLLKRLQGDDNFWYVNYPFEKKADDKGPVKRNTPLTETPLFQTILWLAIIGGFAAFVIIYLANSNIGLFRKKNSAIQSDEEMDTETDNIFEINYQKEIDKAVGKGNYRFAVRLMFLQQLKRLSDKNIIQYKTDRTNLDYLVQLHSTKHYNDFFRLTRNYEYSWYGQFDIDKEKFYMIRNDFENFDNKLRY